MTRDCEQIDQQGAHIQQSIDKHLTDWQTIKNKRSITEHKRRTNLQQVPTTQRQYDEEFVGLTTNLQTIKSQSPISRQSLTQTDNELTNNLQSIDNQWTETLNTELTTN